MLPKARFARGTTFHVPYLVHQNAVIPSESVSVGSNAQILTVTQGLVSQLNIHGFVEDPALDTTNALTAVETPGNLSSMWKACRDVAILRTVAEMLRTAVPEDWPDKQTYSVSYRLVGVELSEGMSFTDSKTGLPSVTIQVTWCYRNALRPSTRVLQLPTAPAAPARRPPPRRTGDDERRGRQLTREELEEALRQLKEKERKDALEAERRRLAAEKARAMALAAEIAAEAARVEAERADRARLQAEADRLRLEAEKADEDERLRAEAEALAAAVRAAEEKAKADALAAAAAIALDSAEKSEEETIRKSQEQELELRRRKEKLDLETRLLLQKEFEERERLEAEQERARLAALEREQRFLQGEDVDDSSTDGGSLPETEPDGVMDINADTSALLRYLLAGVAVSPSASRTSSVSKSADSTTRSESPSIFDALEETSSPVLRSPSLVDMRTLVASAFAPLSGLTEEEQNRLMSNYVNISPLKLSPDNVRQSRLQSTESMSQTLQNLEVQEQNTETGSAERGGATGRSEISKVLQAYFRDTALSTEKRGSPEAFTSAVVHPENLTTAASNMTVGVYEHFADQFHATYPERVLQVPVVDTVLFMDLLRDAIRRHATHDFYEHLNMHIKQSDLLSETSENFIPRIRVSSSRMVLYTSNVKPRTSDTSWTSNDIKLVTGILKSTSELIDRVTKETVSAVKEGALSHLKNSMLSTTFDNLLSYSSAVPTALEQATEQSAWGVLEQRYPASIVSRMSEIENMPGNAQMENLLKPFSGDFNAVVNSLVGPDSEQHFAKAIVDVFRAIALFYNASYRAGVVLNKKLETLEVRRIIRVIRGLVNQELNSEQDLKPRMYAEISAALKKYDIIITAKEAIVKWNGNNIRDFVTYWTALVCASKVANIDLPGWLPFSTVEDVYVTVDDADLYQFLRAVQTLRHNKHVPNVDDELYGNHVRSIRNMALLSPCINYLSQVKMDFVVKSLKAMEFQARLWMQESVNALRLLSMQLNAVHKSVRVYADSRGTPALPSARTNLRAVCTNFMAACDILVAYTTNLRMSFGVYFMLSQYLIMLGSLRSSLISTIPADRQRFFALLNSRSYSHAEDFPHRAYFLHFARAVFGVNYDETPMEYFHRLFMNPHDVRYYALDMLKEARGRVADLISLDQYSPLTLARIMQATTMRDITLFDYDTYAPDKYIAAVEEEQTMSPLIIALYMSTRAKHLPRLLRAQEPLYAWKTLEVADDGGDERSYLAMLLERERRQRESAGPVPAGLSSIDGDQDSDVSIIPV